MGFNPTFYAGRPKLSQVTIDSDLNMGGRDISGVDTLRAGRVYSPIDTHEWPTEELDWGDVPATEVITHESVSAGSTGVTLTLLTATESVEVAVRVTSLPTSEAVFRSSAAVKVNDVDVFSLDGLGIGQTATTPTRILHAGDVLSVFVASTNINPVYAELAIIYTGRVVDVAKTFNLADKWLALGIDMQGLAATVKIQGVEMPYSDYAKYFPLAPTELTIPGGWDASQVRPIVEVYL